MASIREVMAAGTAWPLARMIGQNRLRLVAAAGAAQDDATALTVNYATIATTGPGQGVRLGYAVGAAWNALLNLGPDPVLVYPAEDESINDQGPDLPLAVPAGNLMLALPSVDRWLAVSAPGDAGAIADAPADGMLYGRQTAAWAPVPPPGIGDAPADGQLYVRAQAAWAVMPPPPPPGDEAPYDGLTYGRAMGAWNPAAAEAPEDGQLYGRQSQGWAPVPPPGIAEAPDDAFPYQRYGAAWTRLAALYPAMFGAAADGSDATGAMQAGLDTAFNFGLDFVVAGGVYCVTGLKTYSGVTVRFTAGGSLKMTAPGAGLATLPAPGAPAGATRGVTIDKPIIDLAGNPGAGIILEGCLYSKIVQPRIKGVAGPGSFSWSDPYAPSGQLPNTGLILKGITGISGCYYNTIENVDIEVGSGNYGIWLGTSPGGASSRANFNQIYGGFVQGCQVGIYLSCGGDCTIDSVDVSNNATGVALGIDGLDVHRTHIVKLYCEGCTTGVHIGSHADRTVFFGCGSWAGTVTPVREDPPASSSYNATQFINVDTAAGPGQLVDFQTALTGGLFNILSGAGNADPSGFGLFAYGEGPVLFLGRYDGTPQAKSPAPNNAILGQIVAVGYDGNALATNTDTSSAADISLQAAEAWSPTAHGTRLLIHLTALGTIGPRVLELQMDTTGARFGHGIGLWGRLAPATQPAAVGNTHVLAAGSTTQVFTNTTFDGGQGTTGFTIGDIVRALKQYGLIVQ